MVKGARSWGSALRRGEHSQHSRQYPVTLGVAGTVAGGRGGSTALPPRFRVRFAVGRAGVAGTIRWPTNCLNWDGRQTAAEGLFGSVNALEIDWEQGTVSEPTDYRLEAGVVVSDAE